MSNEPTQKNAHVFFRKDNVNMDKQKACEKISELASMDASKIFKTEDDVKNKFLVRLLEALGHPDEFINLQYSIQGKLIDVFIGGLPKRSTVFFETKKFGEDLNKHIGRLKMYADLVGALIACITNAEDLHIYCPGRGCKFHESLMYKLKRKDFSKENILEIVYGILSREQLVSGSASKLLREREDEIRSIEDNIETLEDNLRNEQKEFQKLQSEYKKRITEIESQVDSLKRKLPYSPGISFTAMTPERTATVSSNPSRTRAKGKMITQYQVEIELPETFKKGWIKYNLIRLPKEVRSIFPGYKIPFVLETDIGPIRTEVTSYGEGTQKGDRKAGYYFSGMKSWYENHGELKPGDILILTKLSEDNYRLAIKKQYGTE